MMNEELDHYNGLDDEVDEGDSSLIDGEAAMEDEYFEDEEYTHIRKEHVFGQIDFTRRKTKIIATLG